MTTTSPRPPAMDDMVAYQRQLKAKCSLRLTYDAGLHHWIATVTTESNAWPHWQSAHADPPAEAWQKLAAYLDGAPQLHGNLTIMGADFKAPPVTCDWRLILAAPDLLAALEAMLHSGSDGSGDYVASVDAAKAQARAAIARATEGDHDHD